ncbi:MAG: MFS transporter [Candidatus Micrarchaeota archaeon]
MGFKELIGNASIRSILFTQMLTAVGFGIILPIVPFYSEEFGASAFQIGLLTAVFALLNLLLAPFVGRLADRIGRKKVLLAGTIGFAVAYLIFAFAQNLETLFIARGVEAIAAAGIFPACTSLISDLTNEQQRGKAMALIGMTFSMGFILGPAIGGLAASISIQFAFLLAASLSVLNFLSVNFQITEPKEKPESRDIVGKEISLLSHLSSPLILIFASSMTVSFIIGGLQAVLALYSQAKLGFGEAEIGIVFTFIGILIMIFQFISGSLMGRFGEVNLIKLGLFLSALGYTLLVFFDSWLTLLVPLSIMVMGNAFVFPSVASLVSKRSSGKRGAVMGLVASFQSFGQFIGPLLAGLLYGIEPHLAFLGLGGIGFIYFIVFLIVEK